jgi:hypothetical protein
MELSTRGGVTNLTLGWNFGKCWRLNCPIENLLGQTIKKISLCLP